MCKISKEKLFYIAWILMEVHICMANSNASMFSLPFISYLCMGLFLIKIIWTGQYKVKQLTIMAILIFGGLMVLKNSGDMRVLWFAVVLSASKNIDFDKTVRISFITMLCCCVIFMAMYFTGIIDGSCLMSTRGIRMSLGLGHPNMCAAYYSLLISHILYLYYNKLKVRDYVILCAGAFFVYYITKSNTGLIVAILTQVMTFFIQYLPFKKLNIKIIVIILLLCIVTFTFMPIFYKPSFASFDSLVTGRIHQANYYYQKYGITFFGNDISYDLNKWNTDNILDMGYSRMLICNGIFYYVLVIGGYLVSFVKILREQRRDLLALISIMTIYMMTENVATYIFMNVSMILFSQFIFCNLERGKSVEYIK